MTLAVHVLGVEPRLEPALDRRPLIVGDRIPGGVAVAALDHLVLAKDALEGEPKALRGAARGGIERVALPLNPTVPQVVERMVYQQVDRLGSSRRAL